MPNLLHPLEVPEQMPGEVLVARAVQQRVGVAAHAGAARAAHAVRVRVDVARHRVVHHRADVRDVQPTGWPECERVIDFFKTKK